MVKVIIEDGLDVSLEDICEAAHALGRECERLDVAVRAAHQALSTERHDPEEIVGAMEVLEKRLLFARGTAKHAMKNFVPHDNLAPLCGLLEVGDKLLGSLAACLGDDAAAG